MVDLADRAPGVSAFVADGAFRGICKISVSTMTPVVPGSSRSRRGQEERPSRDSISGNPHPQRHDVGARDQQHIRAGGIFNRGVVAMTSSPQRVVTQLQDKRP